LDQSDGIHFHDVFQKPIRKQDKAVWLRSHAPGDIGILGIMGDEQRIVVGFTSVVNLHWDPAGILGGSLVKRFTENGGRYAFRPEIYLWFGKLPHYTYKKQRDSGCDQDQRTFGHRLIESPFK